MGLLSPIQANASFPVQWSGTDQGAGIGTFDVFVSDNNGPFTAWQTQITATQAAFTGVAGHTYRFYSIARDLVGNVEAAKTVAEATTVVSASACTFTMTPTSVDIPAAGGFGGFTLSASGAHCGWSSKPSASWLVARPTSGTGTATINWNATTNTSALIRSATITAGGIPFTANQAGSTCTFSLSASSASAPVEGLVDEVNLTVSTPSCAWSARSAAPWLQVFPLTGTGAGKIRFTAFPNFNTQKRTATLAIAGQPFEVTQLAAGGTAAERLVRLLYFGVLGRLPTLDELAYHIKSGASNTQLVINFLRAEEFKQNGRYAAGLYVGLLDRDAEFNGWRFQRDALRTGVTNQWAIVDSFIGSLEYKGKFGSPNDLEFVRLLYRYVLLREATAGEAAFHAGTIPQLGRAGVARSFLLSDEFVDGTQARLTAFLLFATLLLREPSQIELALRMQQLKTGGDAALAGVINACLGGPELQALIQ
jgi:hypothetical protein